MALLLRVAGLADAEPDGRLVEVDASLRIGRGTDNDLVLPDPERTLSKTHCLIQREGSRYVLFDASANGTFLNDRSERLPRDRATPLAVGDDIRLGPFTLSVVSVIVPDLGEDLAAPRGDLLGPISNAPPRASSAPAAPAQREIDELLSDNPAPGRSVETFLGETEPDQWQDFPSSGAAQPDHTTADADSLGKPTPHKEPIPDDWDPLAEFGGAAPPPIARRPPPVLEPAAEPDPFEEAPAARQDIPPTPVPPAIEETRRAVDVLLAACGLNTAALSDARALVAAERAGRILRIAIDGLLRILGGRSLAKQEFGVERTAISRGANNPMKFVTTVDEALHMLLCSDTPGFLSAEDAVRETVTDIQSHQLALLSAVQAAFTESLRSLDPEAIEAALPHHAADPLVPTLRKARAWEQFRAKFAELTRSLAGDGRDVFGNEFARAYALIQQAAARSRNGAAEKQLDDA
jgi:type VI secretion system FHA domain protein